MNAPAGSTVVLFDLDGTLVDSVADLTVSANATLRHFGLGELDQEQVASYIGDGARKLLERCLSATGSEADVSEALRRFRDHYLVQCTQRTQPYPEVMEGLRELRDRRMAIVTNKPEPMAARIAAALELDQFLDAVVGARPRTPVKPDPALLDIALEQLGGAGDGGAWMVGDSANDVRAGKARGLRTIAVTWGFSERAELETLGADHVVDRFSEVVGLVAAG